MFHSRLSLSLCIEISEYTRSQDSENSNGWKITWTEIFEKLKSNRTLFSRCVLEVFLVNAENLLKPEISSILNHLAEFNDLRALPIIDLFWEYKTVFKKSDLIDQTISILRSILNDDDDKSRKRKSTRITSTSESFMDENHHSEMSETCRIYFLKCVHHIFEATGIQKVKNLGIFECLTSKWFHFISALDEESSTEYIREVSKFTRISLTLGHELRHTMNLTNNFAQTSLSESPAAAKRQKSNSINSDSSGFETEIQSEIQSTIMMMRQDSLENSTYNDITSNPKYLCSQLMAVEQMLFYHEKRNTALASDDIETQINCERYLRDIVKNDKYPEILNLYYKIYNKLPPVKILNRNKQFSISKDYLSPKTLLLLDTTTLEQLIPSLFKTQMNALIFENAQSMSTLGAHLVAFVPVFSKEIEARVEQLQNLLLEESLEILKSRDRNFESKTNAIQKFLIGIAHGSWNLPENRKPITEFSKLQINFKASNSTEITIKNAVLNISKIEKVIEKEIRPWNISKPGDYISFLKILNSILFYIEPENYEKIWNLSKRTDETKGYFKKVFEKILKMIKFEKLSDDDLMEIVLSLPINNKSQALYSTTFKCLLKRSIKHGLTYFDRMYDLNKTIACENLTQQFFNDYIGNWPEQPEHPFLHKPILVHLLNNLDGSGMKQIISKCIKSQISLCNILSVYLQLDYDENNQMHDWLKKMITKVYYFPRNTIETRKKLLKIASNENLRKSGSVDIKSSDEFIISQYKEDFMKSIAVKYLPVISGNLDFEGLELTEDYYYELIVHDPTLLPKHFSKLGESMLNKLFLEVTGILEVDCLNDIQTNTFSIMDKNSNMLIRNAARYR